MLFRAYVKDLTTGELVEQPTNYTATMIRDNSGTIVEYPIEYGVDKSVTIGTATKVKYKIDSDVGYLIDSVEVTGISGKGTKLYSNINNNTYTTPILQRDTFLDNTLPNYIKVILKEVTPQKPTIIKNFKIGDSRSGTGSEINQYGAVECTAKVIVKRVFNASFPDEPLEVITPITLGVLTPVDIYDYESVKLVIESLPNHVFTLANFGNRGNTVLPYEPTLLEHNYTATQLADTNYYFTYIQVQLEASAIKTFYFGNDVDATGKPIKTGENSFTGVVTLYGSYDPMTGAYPEKTFNVESGTELDIALTPDFSSGKIELTVVDGFEFIGVNFPYEATFTNNTVSYEFPSYSYDDIPEDKEELDPLDEMNRYYVAITKSTGGVDPEPSDEPSTIANNYLVTKEELADFNKQIYNIVGFEQTENVRTLITEYISAIRIYPFILPPENLYNRGNIKIKRSELNTATIINSDIITVDLGNINITRKYNNALDFINVKPELILPFCSGSISIDPEYLLGSTVNIQMKINIISGNTTINLKSDLIDGIFEVKTDSIGSDYPFYGRSDIVQKTFEPNQAVNNIDTAYIILETPIYTESVIKSKKEGLLTDVKGDVIVDSIKLNVLATTEEKEDLQYLLKNGVFIK